MRRFPSILKETAVSRLSESEFLEKLRCCLQTQLQRWIVLGDVCHSLLGVSVPDHPIHWHTPNWKASNCTAYSNSCPLTFCYFHHKVCFFLGLFFQDSLCLLCHITFLCHFSNFLPSQKEFRSFYLLSNSQPSSRGSIRRKLEKRKIKGAFSRVHSH